MLGYLIAALVGSAVTLLVQAIRASNQRDEAAIQAWEAQGHVWIREGLVKKGGLNGPPTSPRPPAPVSFRPLNRAH